MNPLEISPEQFRQLAQRVTTIATEYLASIRERETFPANASATNPWVMIVGMCLFSDLFTVLTNGEFRPPTRYPHRPTL